jgi:hypothetical protein
VGYCSDELVVVVGGYDNWVVKAEIFGCHGHGGDVVFYAERERTQLLAGWGQG